MSTDFERILAEAEALPVSEWDTTPVDGRWRTVGPPWDYRQLVRERVASVTAVLDLGTGGGEFLSSLAPLPRSTWATEGYAPNLPIARHRLKPLGVRVLPIGPDNRIDLPTASVELVVCRHAEFDPNEVRRVLARGGIFVTQQVGARNYDQINQRLRVPHPTPTNAVRSARELAAAVSSAGLTVTDRREGRFSEAFLDVGALAWYLRFVPWQVPGFSVARFREDLLRIHQDILQKGEFAVTAHRLLVIANRP